MTAPQAATSQLDAPAASLNGRGPASEGLVVSGVSRSYSGRVVLDRADLTVAPGDSALITGANGAGKTTLLRIAAGILSPEGGTVSLYGLDPEGDRRAYQSRLGFMAAGDRGLYARLTVEQNLDFWARICFLPRESRGSRVAAALERFRLNEFARRRADRLSMGQRQRVRLAMTFMHEPDLVLLDEPGSSLDQEGLAMLSGAMADLTAGGGSVLSAAPTGDHERLPHDRAYIVKDGQLTPWEDDR